MKIRLGVLMLSVLILSCNRKTPLTQQQEAFISAFNRELKLPLTIDSSFIAGLDTLEALDLSQLEALKKDSIRFALAGDLQNSLQGCMLIEMLKQAGRYRGYLDSLDIGMLKNAMAFKLGKTKLANGDALLLWGINEGSFDADPGYSGVTIMASCPALKGGFTHILVGQEYNAGDPPMMMSRRTASRISENGIERNTLITTEDLDAGTRTGETDYLKLKFDQGEIVIEQKASGSRAL